MSIGREAPSTKSPCSNMNGGYLNKKRKSDSSINSRFYAHAAREAAVSYEFLSERRKRVGRASRNASK